MWTGAEEKLRHQRSSCSGGTWVKSSCPGQDERLDQHSRVQPQRLRKAHDARYDTVAAASSYLR